MNSYRVLIPVALGLLAGVLNFLAVRGATAPLEIIAVSRPINFGEVLELKDLEKLAIRADDKLLSNAVPWSKCGDVVGRRVNRTLKEKEILFFRDALGELGEDISANLEPGYRSQMVVVKTTRIVPGLRVGETVVFVIKSADASPPGKLVSPARVGPFKVIGLTEDPDGPTTGPDRQSKVVVAVPKEATTAKEGTTLKEAQQLEAADQVLGVEIFRANR
jgi:hypothetical protein